MNSLAEAPALKWRRAVPSDLAAISCMADQVHVDLPERPEVFAEKMRLFPEGCFVLAWGHDTAGYALSHPWKLCSIPPLDDFLGRLPAGCECLFVHDVVLLAEARGRKAGAALVEVTASLARSQGLRFLALVSVYDTYAIWERLGFTAMSDPALADKLASYGDTARYMVRALE